MGEHVDEVEYYDIEVVGLEAVEFLQQAFAGAAVVDFVVGESAPAAEALEQGLHQFAFIEVFPFVFIFIADSIGQIKIPVWKGTFIIFPIFYALFLGILTGPNVLKILDDKKVKAASGLVGVAILPFVAKLGINAGANISIVISAGPALLLQEFGNLCTIFLAMPAALALGLKREAIGAAHSINRETNLALMQDMFGADSPEAQGSLSVYIVGGMVGTIYFGFMASMAAATGLVHPYALGMASGVGAGILMSSAVAALSEVMPA